MGRFLSLIGCCYYYCWFCVCLHCSIAYLFVPHYCWKPTTWSSPVHSGRNYPVTSSAFRKRKRWQMGLSSGRRSCLCPENIFPTTYTSNTTDQPSHKLSSTTVSITSDGKYTNEGHVLLSSDGYLTGRVHRVAVAAQGLNLVTIEVPALLRQSYLYAGQYVKMRPKKQATAEATEEFKTAFFAILSPPDFVTASSPVPRNSDTKASAVVLLTFLVKDIPNHAFLFTHSQSIEMSLAHGTGFGIEDLPMDDSAQHDGRGHTLFVATGSGLAPIAAALESRRPKQAPRMADSSATLLLGVRSPAHLPLHEQLFLWAHERQVQIILVFSQAFEPSALSIPAALERPEHATMMVMSISSTLELNYKQLSFGTCVFPSKQRHQQGLQVPCMFGGYVQDYLQAHWYLQGSLVPPVYPPALESAMPPPQQQQQEHSQLPQEPPLQQQEEEETKTTKKTMHVFVCGQRGMTNRVRELCVEAGVPAKHILTNC